jgi:molecular chaperone GrpE
MEKENNLHPSDEKNSNDVAVNGNSATESRTDVSSSGSNEAESMILKQLLAVQNETNMMKDQLTRALADLENLRKRTLREKVEMRQQAAAAIAEDILLVLDNMRMGIESAKKSTDAKNIVEGFAMVYEQLKKILSGHGLEEMAAKDAIFDVNLHDCVSKQHHPAIEDGHVIEIVRPGYMLNGKVLRHATVIVSSGPEA